MVITRVSLLLVAATFFATAASACTCMEETNYSIANDFNAPGTVVFRGTVLSSTLSSQCVAQMKAASPDDEPSASNIDALDRRCSISNTLEIHDYLKGHLAATLVVETIPMFMGIGSCATYLPPGSTFTIIAKYNGVSEIAVDQCSKIFDEQTIERVRELLKKPDIDKDYRDEWQQAARDYETLYALSKEYKTSLDSAGKDNGRNLSASFARVRIMLDRNDWTSAMHELQSLSWQLESSKDKKIYKDLMAKAKALTGSTD